MVRREGSGGRPRCRHVIAGALLIVLVVGAVQRARVADSNKALAVRDRGRGANDCLGGDVKVSFT